MRGKERDKKATVSCQQRRTDIGCDNLPKFCEDAKLYRCSTNVHNIISIQLFQLVPLKRDYIFHIYATKVKIKVFKISKLRSVLDLRSQISHDCQNTAVSTTFGASARQLQTRQIQISWKSFSSFPMQISFSQVEQDIPNEDEILFGDRTCILTGN